MDNNVARDEANEEINLSELEDLINANEDEQNNSDEEVELTSAQVIQMMEEIWVNEKFAPEVLPNKYEVVECLLEQMNNMEENIKNLDSTDFKKSIYQLEIDRIRFLVTSYLRKRLDKIETYVVDILKKEDERLENGQDLYLTPNELTFAKNYKEALDQHFENVTSFHSGLPVEQWNHQPVVPNLHSFVFLKSKTNIEGVLIDDGGDEEGDHVYLNPGSQVIISYFSVANLLKKGDVHLI